MSPDEETHSPEAEAVVLGSLLDAGDLTPTVAATLNPDDFYLPRHQVLLSTIFDMDQAGAPVQFQSVVTELRTSGRIASVGGADYLTHLLQQSLPSTIRYYVEVIREKAGVRRLRALHNDGLQHTQDGSGLTLQGMVAATQAELDQLSDTRVTSDLVRIGETLDVTIDQVQALAQNDGGITGVPTGFIELDKATSGLQPGQMIIVAARPAVGKSTLALDICRSAAIRHQLPTAMFSLEMSRDEINMRMLSSEARVKLPHIRSGKLSDEEWERIGIKQPEIANAPLWIDDTAETTMQEIRVKARRVKQRHGLRLICIDYIGLLSSGKKTESRQVEVSEFSRQIKLLAKELQVPVVALAQLNRGPEQRADGTPKLSDLRESGSLEQDADLVLLLSRDEVIDPNSARVGEADLYVAKQRNGPTPKLLLGFQGIFSRFVDAA